MRRRQFVGLVAGGLFAWPLVAHAQPSEVPVVGFLSIGSQHAFAPFLAAFHRGMNAAGYVEGGNVSVEYRWAEGDFDRLRQQALELAGRRVALIVASGGTAAAKVAASAAPGTPILFVSGFDPVQFGLVASLSRPGGNATGLSLHTTELVAKRLEFICELTPKATKIAMLVNPTGVVSEIEKKELMDAAQPVGLQTHVFAVSSESDFAAAFASAKEHGAEGLLVSADPFFTSKRAQIVQLAASHALPAVYPWREYPMAGGLMSYGPSITDAYQKIGGYAGRVLAGAKPADLPVQVPTKFELIINMKTAQALGISVSPWLRARADEVIE
ncbi:MAG TPA: ABC transporter substrate-binding protein [Xanthobacteraceae bacterium]|nr:ABC transporter substrate-binding protein [Xanthobacteraceae bacterium]